MLLEKIKSMDFIFLQFLAHLKKTTFQIKCIPELINTFEMLQMPTCSNKQEEEDNLKILFSDTFPRTDCDCLDPCSQNKYKFKVSLNLK